MKLKSNFRTLGIRFLPIALIIFTTCEKDGPPVAAFIASPTTITVGQSVQFTDQSTNIPTSWSWNFGDGATSTVQNPAHVYSTAGTYTVTLTATNSAGSDGESKTGYITVNKNGMISSIRWKNNITAIPNPLEMIKALRGVYFDWNAEHGGIHDLGFIAEEVGKVLPEIVIYEENGVDAIGMDYSKMTPLLLEGIKKLKAENDELRARLEKIEILVGVKAR